MKHKKPKSKREQRAIDMRALEKASVDMYAVLRDRGLLDTYESYNDAVVLFQELREEFGEEFPPRVPTTDVERAQDIAYEAFAATGARRAELAQKALEVSPDCADAYVILAEETATTNEEALDLYKQGVEAAERALGKEFFERERGHFWARVEARPYMRARLGMAQTLWALGEKEAAIAHLKEMLRLNTKDDQGVRYALLNYLLTVEDNDSIADLIKSYPSEGTAEWLYSRALYTFRKAWRSILANDILNDAIGENPYIAVLIVSDKPLPDAQIDYSRVEPGSPVEALTYVQNNRHLWKNTKGAVDWLLEEFYDESMAMMADDIESL